MWEQMGTIKTELWIGCISKKPKQVHTRMCAHTHVNIRHQTRNFCCWGRRTQMILRILSIIKGAVTPKIHLFNWSSNTARQESKVIKVLADFETLDLVDSQLYYEFSLERLRYCLGKQIWKWVILSDRPDTAKHLSMYLIWSQWDYSDDKSYNSCPHPLARATSWPSLPQLAWLAAA